MLISAKYLSDVWREKKSKEQKKNRGKNQANARKLYRRRRTIYYYCFMVHRSYIDRRSDSIYAPRVWVTHYRLYIHRPFVSRPMFTSLSRFLSHGAVTRVLSILMLHVLLSCAEDSSYHTATFHDDPLSSSSSPLVCVCVHGPTVAFTCKYLQAGATRLGK